MAQTLTVENYDPLNIVYADKIDADSNVGDTVLTVPNTSGYTTNQYAIAGPVGSEAGELVKFGTNASATQVNLQAALTLAHRRFDPLTLLYGNQVRIYRAPNVNGLPPDDSTYVLQSTLTINYDEEVTYYTDAAGSNAYWYKYTFYNSQNLNESNIAESIAVRGGGFAFYCSLTDIRKAAGMMDNQFISNADINFMRVEAQQEIHNALQGEYDVPFALPCDPMITAINRLLAAGKLLMNNPGSMGRSGAIYQEGEDKTSQARTMLQLIQERKYILTDANGTQLLDPNAQATKAWPNSTTSSVSRYQGGSHRNFRMGDVQDGCGPVGSERRY